MKFACHDTRHTIPSHGLHETTPSLVLRHRLVCLFRISSLFPVCRLVVDALFGTPVSFPPRHKSRDAGGRRGMHHETRQTDSLCAAGSQTERVFHTHGQSKETRQLTSRDVSCTHSLLAYKHMHEAVFPVTPASPSRLPYHRRPLIKRLGMKRRKWKANN